MKSLTHLKPEQQASIKQHIDREMGKRAGHFALIYVVFLLALAYFSEVARAILPMGYIPGIALIIAAFIRPVVAAKLVAADLSELAQYRRRYLWATQSIVFSWSCLVVLFIFDNPDSSVTTLALIASTAMTVGGMGSMTQYRIVWRYFQLILWVPIFIALITVLPDAQNEFYVLSIFIGLFAFTSTRIGDHVTTEYQQSQVSQLELLTQTRTLALT